MLSGPDSHLDQSDIQDMDMHLQDGGGLPVDMNFEFQDIYGPMAFADGPTNLYDNGININPVDPQNPKKRKVSASTKMTEDFYE